MAGKKIWIEKVDAGDPFGSNSAAYIIHANEPKPKFDPICCDNESCPGNTAWVSKGPMEEFCGALSEILPESKNLDVGELLEIEISGSTIFEYSEE